MIAERIISERTEWLLAWHYDRLSVSKENYVNVYRISQCYGGPEEGGWYYSAWDCVASIEIDRLTLREKLEVKALLEKQYPPKCQLTYEEYWGTDADDYEVLIENRKAERATKEIPRYE